MGLILFLTYATRFFRIFFGRKFLHPIDGDNFCALAFRTR